MTDILHHVTSFFDVLLHRFRLFPSNHGLRFYCVDDVSSTLSDVWVFFLSCLTWKSGQIPDGLMEGLRVRMISQLWMGDVAMYDKKAGAWWNMLEQYFERTILRVLVQSGPRKAFRRVSTPSTPASGQVENLAERHGQGPAMTASDHLRHILEVLPHWFYHGLPDNSVGTPNSTGLWSSLYPVKICQNCHLDGKPTDFHETTSWNSTNTAFIWLENLSAQKDSNTFETHYCLITPTSHWLFAESFRSLIHLTFIIKYCISIYVITHEIQYLSLYILHTMFDTYNYPYDESDVSRGRSLPGHGTPGGPAFLHAGGPSAWPGPTGGGRPGLLRSGLWLCGGWTGPQRAGDLMCFVSEFRLFPTQVKVVRFSVSWPASASFSSFARPQRVCLACLLAFLRACVLARLPACLLFFSFIAFAYLTCALAFVFLCSCARCCLPKKFPKFWGVVPLMTRRVASRNPQVGQPRAPDQSARRQTPTTKNLWRFARQNAWKECQIEAS